MSFLKITDPSKRAAIVDEYLKLKKSIQQSSLSEKLGDSDLQRDLIKLYKPITESQAGIAKELSDTSTALKALPESISTSLQAIMPAELPFAQYPSIEAFETSSPAYDMYGPVANKYLHQYTTNKDAIESPFGIKTKNNLEYLGTLPIKIQGDDITVGGKTYTGTPGLWELIVMNEPDKSIYTDDDLENYETILVKTNAYCAIDKKTGARILHRPAASTGYKYNEIIKTIWHRNKPKARTAFGTTLKSDITPGTKGKGVSTPVILPSDPNELSKMLKLRMDASEAGNTGAANEAVAICDALRNQGVIDKKTYKLYITSLNRL